MQQDLRRSHFIPYFDGLRGFGAFIVFVCHMGLSGLWRFGPPAPFQFLTNGAFAVDMFFALSGCVMAMLATRSDESFLAICVRRWARLAIPAAVTCMLSAIVLGAGLYHNQEVAALNGSDWLKAWFNFHPKYWGALREGLIHIFEVPESAYNSSLWTMRFELWCSFAIFAGIYLFRVRWLCFLAAAAATYYIGLKFQTAPVSFCIGALTYYLRDWLGRRIGLLGRGWRIIGASLATVAVVYGFYLGSYPGLSADSWVYTWFPTDFSSWQWKYNFGGSLVVLAIGGSPVFCWLFSRRLMLWLGKISFAFYLVHLPLICSVGSWLGIAFYPATVVPSFMTLGIVLAVAVLFERTVDRSAIAVGRWMSASIDRLDAGARRQIRTLPTLEPRPQMVAAE